MAVMTNARMQRMTATFRYTILFSLMVICVLVVQDILDFRLGISKMLTVIHPTTTREIITMNKIVYEKCTKIPLPTRGRLWPEEKFIHDPQISNIQDIADSSNSRVWIEGQPEVRVGDTVHIRIELYDGYGKMKKTGGDLVRVWMKEPELGASTTAVLIDNNDGSYSGILTAFWEGKPTIKAAIISPREVIATVFRRRYICPPVLMNTAVFKHPSIKGLVEETPCNYDPQVPGYPEMCNFTGENYGSPWYCGVPKSKGLLCHDWAEIANLNLWLTGDDLNLLTPTELELVNLKYSCRTIPTNITLTVKKDHTNQTRVDVTKKCNTINTTVTWSRSQAIGYLYNRKWQSRHCSGLLGHMDIASCLMNTKVILIGDSTVRQLFEGLKRKMPCEWLTGAGLGTDKSSKHRPAICINEIVNFTMIMEEHTLPFCTMDTPRTYLKTFEAHLNTISVSHEKTILVLHGFAHFLNHHSHVFYETLLNMKRGVLNLLKRHPNIFIVIKGPNTFSFAKNPDQVMWMPDKYADIYQDLIYDVFMDLSDRVMYLNCQDITIATEQWHVHAENYIIDALVGNMLSHACQY